MDCSDVILQRGNSFFSMFSPWRTLFWIALLCSLWSPVVGILVEYSFPAWRRSFWRCI